MLKNALIYLGLIVATFFLIRGYDYITKKPKPVSREKNPEIVRLDSIIKGIQADQAKEKLIRETADRAFISKMDSISINHKKGNNEHKTLKNTPDAGLIHYRDSVRKANGL